MRLCAAALTDKGKKRSLNEDTVWAQTLSYSDGDPLGLFIVCDGVGGHLGGECASYWAVEAVKRELAVLFKPVDPLQTIQLSEEEVQAVVAGKTFTRRLADDELRQRILQAVQRAVQLANQVVYEYAQRKPSKAYDAGTTITLALVKGAHATIANVGDSRTYLLRGHTLRQVTTDHSLVAALLAAGQISAEAVYDHPQRNVILRSLGQKEAVEVDLFSEALQPGDTLLLCSDGLWEMVRDPREMVRLIQSSTEPTQACQKLIDAANAAGGDDNIGVVLARLE